MREKELRIALVCFGGVSLAIYMHGITKEILKLVRASSALHAIADRQERASAEFFDRVDRDDPEYDTEEIYFDLLREISRKLELRVIVDIIAGASAGGINGTMLARALSHDLSMEPLRDLWIDNADVTVLLAPEARAGTWSKIFLIPFIWGAIKAGILPIVDPEVRKKLSLFLRSRWFKPPLDGSTMDGLMLDATTAMGAPKTARSSLMPSGQALDLFVTLTDYYGYYQLVQIHDPPMIHEVEHHHVLKFHYERSSDGTVESDFVLDNAPSLAFAARATSSFPGAFPPARIVEMDKLVTRRMTSWAMRDDFIAKNFDNYRMADVDPTTASFIDGSVLNNRPFREAISAIRGRPAFRQVDRRLVYIDPDPMPLASMTRSDIPGFFSTLRGAMSDIPRSQPVTDELSWVANFNEQVARIKAVVEGARPHISALVDATIDAPLDRPVSEDMVRDWRERVNAQVVKSAGFAYESYTRLKLASVREYITDLIVDLRGVSGKSPLARAIAAIVDAWAESRALIYNPEEKDALAAANGGHPGTDGALPKWVELLLAFDVKYRERRLHFLIEGQNRLYGMLDSDAYRGLDPQVVDRLKRKFYAKLDEIRSRQDTPSFSPATRELAQGIFKVPPSTAEIKKLPEYASAFVAAHAADIDRLVDQLAAQIGLNSSTHDLDELLARLDPAEWHQDARREVMVNYLGFPFWDVLTFPLMEPHEHGEFNEILVDRISPTDAHVLKGFGGSTSLKGVGFGHFAAFLSRGYRENDYLLGRLHALERLIDIVCDCAGLESQDQINIMALKKRGFQRILDTEAKHLKNSSHLIDAIRRSIDEL
jgi:patatin-related protein